MSLSILLIDDDLELVKDISQFLSSNNFTVHTASTIEEGKAKLFRHPPEIVLLDLKLPDGNGFEILDDIRLHLPDVTTIILSGYGTIPEAVEAIKKGAEDFLTKPVVPDHLLIKLNQIAERNRIRTRLVSQELQIADRFKMVVPPGAKMQKVMNICRNVSQTDSTVLICGETGTGKHLLAYYIHQQSPRRDYPFVYVNCANLSETLLESDLFGHTRGAFTGALKAKPGRVQLANRGTLFLDEIGEVPFSVQSKLLHFIEYGEYQKVGDVHTHHSDVRVICATNRNLKEEIEKGRFREDLYYRINVITIEIPPLRERVEDIPVFVEYFVKKFSRELSKPEIRIPASVMEKLKAYPWNGNIRELENAIERAMVLSHSNRLTEKDFAFLEYSTPAFSATPYSPGPLSEAIRQFKMNYIRSVLNSCGGNQTKAAKILKIQRSYLNRLIREWEN